MKNLAPSIVRQRLLIEGICKKPISDKNIQSYLLALSKELRMITLLDPITHLSQYGWAGWIHWETSGAHFYAWDRPVLFFSVDIYTCRSFDSKAAVKFTKNYFDPEEIAFKEI
jgi:hypothetical protein